MPPAGGPDPTNNAPLATLITSARKQRFPKSSIDNAIARGQGRSLRGAPLESITLETMLPGGVAAIIECETDSRIKTMTDIRTMIKKVEGGGAAPTLHLFDKKGRVVLGNEGGLGEEEVMDLAIEAGAEDVEFGQGEEVEVWCEPRETSKVGKGMGGKGLRFERAEIVWVAREETKVEGPEDAEVLDRLIGM